MERVTRKQLDAKVESVNRRMEYRNSGVRYGLEGRNGYTAIDRYAADGGEMLSHVWAGTKREVSDYLSAMATALDDAARY